MRRVKENAFLKCLLDPDWTGPPPHIHIAWVFMWTVLTVFAKCSYSCHSLVLKIRSILNEVKQEKKVEESWIKLGVALPLGTFEPLT